MRRLVTALLVAFLTVACTLPAFAHASLLSAQPADGAVLTEAPTELVLTFNEPVSPLATLLIGLDGTKSPLDTVSAEGNTLKIALPADRAGTQVISWRAISTDGHPISGTTSFSVGVADVKPVAAESPLHAEVAALLWVTRTVLFVGLFFGAGGAAFRTLSPVLPEPAKRLSLIAAIAGMVAALLVIGLQGLDILGLGLSDLVQGQVWTTGVGSVYGRTSLVALGALVAALAALGARSVGIGKSVGFAAVVLVGLAISLSGHASAAQPQWLMKSALFIHVVAIAWWVGALFPLILLLRAEPGEATIPLLNFSRAIPFAVAPLVISGMVLAAVQMGLPGPAWLSGYGAIIGAKLLFLAMLFAIACWNRWALTAPAASGDKTALLRMRRSIVGEIVLVLAILCLVAGWRFTPPPRALSVEQPAALELTLTQGDVVATVRVVPAKVGPVDFNITLSTSSGAAVSPKAVRISAAPLNADLAAMTRSAEEDAAGAWHINSLPLPLPGTWTVEVEVRVSDFELVKLSSAFELAP